MTVSQRNFRAMLKPIIGWYGHTPHFVEKLSQVASKTANSRNVLTGTGRDIVFLEGFVQQWGSIRH